MKTKDSRKDFVQRDVDNLLSVLLTEYEAMRAEIRQIQSTIGQLVLYGLLSLGAAIPILASSLQNQLWVSLLIAPLVFSNMALVYTGYIGMSHRLSIYIHTQIRPAINALLEKKPLQRYKLMNWENFARSNNLNVLTMPKLIEIMLFLIPSIGSIVLYLDLQNTIGFRIPTAHWVLLGMNVILMIGVIAMAFILLRLGYSRLTIGDEEKDAG